MEHVVRLVLIAFADTIFPANIEELCRQSFEHIQRYFLEEVGATFQVEEPVTIQTHHTAEYFEKRRNEDAPLPKDLDQIGRECGGPNYYQKLSDPAVFGFNLIVFVREQFGTDNSQAWVIFIPVVAKGSLVYTAISLPVELGGYAIISTHLLTHWPPDGRAEGRIAHELCHIFGLDHNQEAVHSLMNKQDSRLSLTECTLNQKECWILSRSPFFTEEEF